MLVIDQYSLAAIPIEMFFNDTLLSVGTAFVWKANGEFFLITNWHNVSGRDPNSGKHLSRTAAEPNRIRVWFNAKDVIGNKVAKFISVRDQDGKPLWLIHPNHGSKVDVVAIPIVGSGEVGMYPINEMDDTNLQSSVGMDVFVLGYPFGLGPSGFPVWKRGSFASEPAISPIAQLEMLIDTASRPGMSGSPVIRRSWGTHMLEQNAIEMGAQTATRFIGVYSGRLTSSDPIDAQLGIAWPASFVPEIVSGAKLDT